MSLASALVLRGLPGRAAREIEAATRDLSGSRRRVPTSSARQSSRSWARMMTRSHELRRALPTLRRAGDAEWAARGLSNRSLIHVRRRAFGAAETDLLEARRLCVEHGLELPAGYAEQNLGFVKAQRAMCPRPCGSSTRPPSGIDSSGWSRPRCCWTVQAFCCRCDWSRRRGRLPRRQSTAYVEQGRDVHVPEAQLMLSTVALLQGDTATAISSAGDAVKRFRRLGHAHSVALAKYSCDAGAGGGRPARA